MFEQKYFSLPLWVWIAIIAVVVFSLCNSDTVKSTVTNVVMPKLTTTTSKPVLTTPTNQPKKERFSEVSKPKIKMFNFNTDWCGWSKRFQPEWDDFSNMVKQNNLSNVSVYDIKCDNPKNEAMCEKYQVPGYPYVVVEVDNKRMPYNGERNANALLNFVKSV